MNKDAISVWGDELTRYFHDLSPDKVLDIAERFGVRCTGRSLQLNSMENRVYQIEIEIDDSDIPVNHPERYRIIKFYRPGRWSYGQIREEHLFLQDLVEVEYPVVAPVLIAEDETIYTDEETGLYVSMFPRIGGRNVDELQESQLAIVGRLLARLHLVGKKRPHAHRLSLDIETYGDSNLDLILSLEVLPKEIETIYIDLVEDLLDLIDPLLEGVFTQRIHGDCHLGNLLDGAQGLFWVDFDDTVMGPPVQDIWLVESGRDEYSKRRLDSLLAAYETFQPFDYSTLKLIEPLRTLRLIHFSAWIGKRYQDGSFKRAYPEYGSPEYWQDQIVTLREQAELISAL
jgi:Ser/Thr protein kinase RdoA (MazF antagonist)